ncbi:MAG: hypothetical protein JST40_01625 [Armatimonadetes bacterium]|nr:hypothetical protein [Armatimonadota bacterium]
MDPQFQLDIDPRFKPVPLWAWNGDMTEARIRETLADFARLGFGGGFIHPRPGLVTEYLSDRWFDLCRCAQSTARELGMEIHIYDENSYPSGFAGGHVLNCHSHLRLQKLVCTSSLEPPKGERIRSFHFGATQLAIEIQETDSSGWYAGKTYVDILNPETGMRFFELTHQRYCRELDCEGLMVFTDEPSVMDYSRGALPWSQALEAAFLVDHGYNLARNLEHLFVDFDSDSRAVRYDFQSTLMSLFSRSFTAPLAERCGAEGLRLTGHLHEHEWPCPRYHANTMFALAEFEIPGIDLLGFQFDPGDRTSSGRWLLTVLEAASVAAQLGKDLVACEAYGGGGYQAGLQDFKKLGDFVLAGGINVIVPHMSYETMVGARKYDWPQTLSDHAPFWEDCEPLQLHQARVATFLSEGVSMARTLVLHPTATGWLDWTPDSEICGRNTEIPVPTEKLRTEHSAFLLSLADTYLDFHLGDEWILARWARVEGGEILVGSQRYDQVIVPPMMETIRSDTLNLLGEFAAAGGAVVLAGAPPTRMDGRESTAPKEAFDSMALSSSISYSDLMLVGANRDGSVPTGLCCARRQTSEGIRWFVANPWDQEVEVSLDFGCPSLIEVDSLTGGGKLVDPRQHIVFAPGHHRLFQEHRTPVPVREPSSELKIPIIISHVERLHPNVLPVDCCSLSVGGESWESDGTIVQNQRLWKSAGETGDPWEWGVQFKSEIVDRLYSAEIQFGTSYTFSSKANYSVKIAAERPHLYEAFFNGQPMNFEGAPFFDEEMRRSEPVETRLGLNEVRFVCHQFGHSCEIAPIWVLGDFAIRNGFLEPSCRLGLGPWGDQGLENYPWTLQYRGSFRQPRDGDLFLQVDGTGISSGEVRIDGQVVSKIWQSLEMIDLGPSLCGAHEIEIHLRGSLRNLFGPFGVFGLPGPWSWYEAASRKERSQTMVHTRVSGFYIVLK